MRAGGSSQSDLLGHYNACHHAAVRQGRIDLDQHIVLAISALPNVGTIGAMTREPAAQQPVIDFLADPATHGGTPVRRVDTHAASVFLAGDRVLKIKRAVRFPFLDFSTLAQRKAACEAEIAVNRAFAPALYRRAVPITRTPEGHLEIGGQGLPVEWAVEMRRFDETQTLDRLAQSDRIDTALADGLGRTVAAAHRVAPAVKNAKFTEILQEIIAQNEAELAGEPDLFSLQDLRALAAATREAFERVKPLLAARERAGLVRRCHGDLHLGNVAVIDGKPVLFDAIEFDDRIATGDVLYDLAFVLMDLVERNLRPAANAVFNRYLIETRRIHDLDALAALPLFMSVRAAIRAKVMAARRRQAAADADIDRDARNYAELARVLLTPFKPELVAIGGLSGTGKSLLARTLAPESMPMPGAVLLRSDVERKNIFGVAETGRLPEAAYAADVTAKVYAALAAKARRVIEAGYSAIVDAVFARPDERGQIENAAGSRHFVGLFLTADLPTRTMRVGGRTNDASDADAAVAEAQEQFDLGRIKWTRLDASGPPEETLIRARATLEFQAMH
jgi:aminoglycoside phosphotransferase family enzyme/predicted kinase